MLKTSRAQNILIWGLCAVVVSVLLWQAYDPAWRSHLQVDVVSFQTRAVYFLNHGSWQAMGYNEYQPGALWFFVLIGRLTSAPTNFEAYLTATVFVNVLLCAAHLHFFQKYTSGLFAPLLFLSLLFAAGPILFYRFELLVSLLVLYAWHYFGRHNFFLAAGLLGVASAVKVYPVILLPLLIIELMRRRRWLEIGTTGLAFAGGLLLLPVLFIAYGGSGDDIVFALNFHQLKSIGLEGVWGTVLVLAQQMAGMPIHIADGYGVHGFVSDSGLFAVPVLNMAWMVPLGAVFFVMAYRFRKQGYTDAGLAFLLLLVFVFFAKVLNPQYIWWCLVFLPLVPPAWFSRTAWIFVAMIAIGSLVVTQAVYPLNYTEFLQWFDHPQTDPTLFYVSVGRNLLLAGLLLFFLSGLGRARTSAKAVAGDGVI